MSGSGPDGPDGPDGAYAPSEGTRRAWAAAQRYRWPIVLGFMVLAVVQVVRGGLGGAALIIALALVVVVAGLALVKGLARWRLAHLPAGALWVGSAALEVADMRTSRKLKAAAPRPGLLSAFLLTYDLAPGVLVLAGDGVSWRPGRLALWAGASSWQVGRHELVVAEMGPHRGLPGPTGLWLRLWLSDRSAVSMKLVTRQDLDAALDALGLAHRRAWPS